LDYNNKKSQVLRSEEMGIPIDEFKLLENEIVNKVLYFALGSNYTEEVDKAKKEFIRAINKDNYSYSEKNFTSWLMWDYKIDNKNNFFEEYMKVMSSKLTDNQYKILKELSDTYLSIYEIIDIKGKKKIVDIFLKKEFIIDEGLERINSNQLLIGRVVNVDGMNYVLDDHSTLDKRFQNGIEKVFYEQFQASKERNSLVSVEEFTKNNVMLISSFTHIIDDITKQQMESNDQYTVYQSNYAVLDREKLCDAFSKSQNIEFDYKENNTLFYIMYKEDGKKVLSEIVLLRDKLEMECISSIDSDDAKGVLEDIASEFIKYMNDEILTLDDLLS
jgi:hypothetical protein